MLFEFNPAGPRDENAETRAPGPLFAPNKKVGLRPLDRATYLEAPKYSFLTEKRQDRAAGSQNGRK
jgi:hypothetical protein